MPLRKLLHAIAGMVGALRMRLPIANDESRHLFAHALVNAQDKLRSDVCAVERVFVTPSADRPRPVTAILRSAHADNPHDVMRVQESSVAA